MSSCEHGTEPRGTWSSGRHGNAHPDQPDSAALEGQPRLIGGSPSGDALLKLTHIGHHLHCGSTPV
ncbi:hypothetical protein JOB18_047923 [Solea senegalensis]|uniref:Uncharacterized protein n=1 Tax=Solea senegalensis TaxID=28829 RepID=A0AAV6RR53_SOLSE|nr:hypothetical protein JOB18_047923 [Solea senegalensis]